MNREASPGVQLFFGIGFFIVAWHWMPAPDWPVQAKIFFATMSLVGTLFVIGAVAGGARRASLWWQGLAGRLIAVGAIWLGIAAAASYYGTPHVLYEYPPRQPAGTCLYLGWRGMIKISAQDLASGCPLIHML